MGTKNNRITAPYALKALVIGVLRKQIFKFYQPPLTLILVPHIKPGTDAHSLDIFYGKEPWTPSLETVSSHQIRLVTLPVTSKPRSATNPGI